MSSSDSDLTSWFDSKLADLQEQIEKLGNGDVAARAPEPRPARDAGRPEHTAVGADARRPHERRHGGA